MEGTVVVVDGKVKTPKQYFLFLWQTHYQDIQRVHWRIFETAGAPAGIIKKSQITELGQGKKFSKLSSTLAIT